MVAGELDGCDHVVGCHAASDDCRLLVDHRVPDGPGVVVTGLTADQYFAGEVPAEFAGEG